jgi:hypothetical protein
LAEKDEEEKAIKAVLLELQFHKCKCRIHQQVDLVPIPTTKYLDYLLQVCKVPLGK